MAPLTSRTGAPSAIGRRGRAEVDRLLADLRRLVDEGHELARRGGVDARRAANRRAAERLRWEIAREVRNELDRSGVCPEMRWVPVEGHQNRMKWGIE